MMSRWSLMAMALTGSLMLCAAPNEKELEKPDKAEPRMERKEPRMEPPVYDKETAPEAFPGKALSPQERAKEKAAHQRRFEIMVLIHAYKIMPEAQRGPLKEELTRRIQEDFEASLARRKARIDAAEKELARLRNEIAEQEKNKEKLVAKEMERLLKMQPPRPGDEPRRKEGNRQPKDRNNGPRPDMPQGLDDAPPPEPPRDK